MCQECGCGLPSEAAEVHTHPHDHAHDHAHPLSHAHPHTHSVEADHAHGAGGLVTPVEPRRVLEVRQAILENNDRQAERNRGFFRARGLLAINVLASPGAGKTTLLEQTFRSLAPSLKTGVIVGDLATDNDARRLHEAGAPVVQITTGTMCHLEAEMVARAASRLDMAGPGLLFIENVGNLVCPAAYDLGEELRVVLLSVTEGEDKPLKYPPVFQSAHAVVISKIDLAQACGFNHEAVAGNLRRIAPRAQVFELSARTGEGMAAWVEYLAGQHEAQQQRDPLAR